MDWRSILLGAGLTIVIGLLPFLGVQMPKAVAWAGVVLGVLMMAWGLPPINQLIPLGPALLFAVSGAGMAGGVAWYLESPVNKVPNAIVGPATAPKVAGEQITQPQASSGRTFIQVAPGGSFDNVEISNSAISGFDKIIDAKGKMGSAKISGSKID